MTAWWIKARSSGDDQDRWFPVGHLLDHKPEGPHRLDWIPYAHGEEIPAEFPELREVVRTAFGTTTLPDMRGFVVTGEGAFARGRTAQWRDPGKPEPGGDWWDVLLYGLVAVACVALAIWLCTRHVDPCPGGWHERTTPTATVCTNPSQQPRR